MAMRMVILLVTSSLNVFSLLVMNMMENIQNRFVIVVVVMLISDLLHILHFCTTVSRKGENIFMVLLPQKLTMTLTLKTTNFAILDVSERSIVKHLD